MQSSTTGQLLGPAENVRGLLFKSPDGSFCREYYYRLVGAVVVITTYSIDQKELVQNSIFKSKSEELSIDVALQHYNRLKRLGYRPI